MRRLSDVGLKHDVVAFDEHVVSLAQRIEKFDGHSTLSSGCGSFVRIPQQVYNSDVDIDVRHQGVSLDPELYILLRVTL